MLLALPLSATFAPAVAQTSDITSMFTDSDFISGFGSMINPQTLTSFMEIMSNPAMFEAMMKFADPEMFVPVHDRDDQPGFHENYDELWQP